ncbi:MAG TPA: hypothetical protein VMV62_00215 [Candidatus Paceibacterota bacterium]|nr:hypothetical protein [Candidatus Paceibacterota bacterium]
MTPDTQLDFAWLFYLEMSREGCNEILFSTDADAHDAILVTRTIVKGIPDKTNPIVTLTISPAH